MIILRKSLKYLYPHGKEVILIMIFMFFSIGMNLLKPWPMKIVVDRILGQKEPHPLYLLNLMVLGTIGIYVIEALIGMAKTYLITNTSHKMVRNIRVDLYTHLQRLSLSFHDNRKEGDSIYRVTNDTFSIQNLFHHGYLSFISSSLTLSGVFIVMMRLDWSLTLISLFVTPLLFLSIKNYAHKIRSYSKEVSEKEGNVTSSVQQTISAIRIVQSFTREDYEINRFQNYCLESSKARLRLFLFQSIFTLSVNTIIGLGSGGLLWLGALHVMQGSLSIGELLVFISYLGMLYGPLSAFSYASSSIHEAMAKLERIFEILDTAQDIKDIPGAEALSQVKGELDFRNVSFGYSPDRPVLKGINFKVMPGEVLAVMGATGVGKTTLMNLILRFYEPSEGSILLDGKDIRKVKLKSLREKISLVLQDALLFPTTIEENICYGKIGASHREVVEAAKLARAHDFIMKLPQGYETQVGERGVKLSGGERQRIAIARAFLKNAPILILDEPTSQLDVRTEAEILESLRHLMEGKTTFIIAHRFSAIKDSHRIMVLHEGMIKEFGSHEELMKIRGIYFNLYRRQTWRKHLIKAA